MMDGNRRAKVVSLIILVSIYLFNDYLFIPVKWYVAWLAIDYSSRIISILVIAWLIARRISDPSEFGLARIGLGRGTAWAVILTVTGILIDQVVWRFFEKILPSTQLAFFPVIKNNIINVFDLTVGVALVGISEELLFRGYFYSVMKSYIRDPLLMIFLSCIVFGFIHWSMGLHAIATTALWGVLPMIALMRTGSVYPAVVAHYLTDLVSMSNVVPEGWFAFLK